MQATISRDSLWQLIQTLSPRNRDWLLDKLQADAHERQAEEETEYISKEELLAGIDAGLKELKLKREGKLETISFDELIEELEHEC